MSDTKKPEQPEGMRKIDIPPPPPRSAEVDLQRALAEFVRELTKTLRDYNTKHKPY